MHVFVKLSLLGWLGMMSLKSTIETVIRKISKEKGSRMGCLEGIIAHAKVRGGKSTEAPKETDAAYEDGPARGMAKGASMGQSGQLLCGRTAASGAFQAGGSHG